MAEALSLYDRVLGKLQEEEGMVTVFTTNGYRMRGKIVGFDPSIVVLDIGGEQAIIYNSAISTIKPDTNIGIF